MDISTNKDVQFETMRKKSRSSQILRRHEDLRSRCEREVRHYEKNKRLLAAEIRHSQMIFQEKLMQMRMRVIDNHKTCMNTCCIKPQNTCLARARNSCSAKPQKLHVGPRITKQESTQSNVLQNMPCLNPQNTRNSKPSNTWSSNPQNTPSAMPRNLWSAKSKNTHSAMPRNLWSAKSQNTQSAMPRNVWSAKSQNTQSTMPRNLWSAQSQNTPSEYMQRTPSTKPQAMWSGHLQSTHNSWKANQEHVTRSSRSASSNGINHRCPCCLGSASLEPVTKRLVYKFSVTTENGHQKYTYSR